MAEVSRPGLLITVADPTANSALLDDLAVQLGPFEVSVGLLPGSEDELTKGAGVVAEILIPLAVLRASGVRIAPILAFWVNRPRRQRVTARFDNGGTPRVVEIDGASQTSEQFAQAVQALLDNIEFPDQPNPPSPPNPLNPPTPPTP